MGTPAFAVPALRAVAVACDVPLVVTQPDRPKGRGRAVGASEVSAEAQRLGIAEVLKPADLRTPDVGQKLGAAGADLFAVVAFGAILPPEILSLPRLGCINLHGSLLPDYRGASPVQRALWDGRAWTGVTTLWMDEGIDTGDCILQRCEPVRSDDDAGTLAARLAEIGAPLLAESLVRAVADTAPRTPQDRTAGSYAKKLVKEDGLVTWALDALDVWNRQRAVTPWPGATTVALGRQLTIVRAQPLHRLPAAASPGTVIAVERDGVIVACAPGALRLERVKPEGRSDMSAGDWARGARVAAGERFGAARETVA
jgi:methionyl-tRNA formyltransferase